MNKRSLIYLVLSLLAVPTLAFSQAPPANNVRPGTAMVSGENPYIRLQDKEGGQMLTVASFWGVTWSPVGPGHVVYITVGEAGTPGEVRIAMYDNEKLFKYMTNEVMGLSDKTYLDRPFTPVPNAKFTTSGDHVKERIDTITGGKYTVQLGWHNLQAPELVDNPAAPPRPFGMTYLRLIATTADVTINGKKAPGTAYGRAALAFGETWLKPKP